MENLSKEQLLEMLTNLQTENKKLKAENMEHKYKEFMRTAKTEKAKTTRFLNKVKKDEAKSQLPIEIYEEMTKRGNQYADKLIETVNETVKTGNNIIILNLKKNGLVDVTDNKKALKGYAVASFIKPNENFYKMVTLSNGSTTVTPSDVSLFLTLCKDEIKKINMKNYNEIGTIKVNHVLKLTLSKKNVEVKDKKDENNENEEVQKNKTVIKRKQVIRKVGEVEYEFAEIYLQANAYQMLNINNQDGIIDTATGEINTLLDKISGNGSGFSVHEINGLYVNTVKFEPMSGSSYKELPDPIKLRKAIINIQNKDNKCFYYSVACGLNTPEIKPERVYHYKNIEEILTINDKHELPFKLTNIPKFEKSNNISINVLTCEFNKSTQQYDILPIYNTKEEKEKHVNLFYYNEHFSYIRSISRLLGSKSHEHKKFYCMTCLNGFHSEEKLKTHKEIGCVNMNEQKTPVEGDNELTFTHFSKMLKCPFVIYSDFESITEIIENDNKGKYQKHIASAYCYNTVSAFEKYKDILPLQTYTGPDAHVKFIQSLLDNEDKLMKKLNKNKEIIMTSEDNKYHKNNNNCHICTKPIENINEKVRDHCHITGKYRGPAHSSCNLNLKYTKLIPVVFHNLKGYDAHHIITAISQFDNIKRLSVIPQSKEKFLSIRFNNFIIIDSYAFLPDSLDNLIKNLGCYKEDEDMLTNYDGFNHTKNYYKTMDFEKLKLLLKKGVYPYDYINTFDKFNEKQLPTKDEFYSKLTESGISKKDYEHAQHVWNTFECETLLDYHNLYLKSDVLLLSDIFENFRNDFISYHSLDPANYITLPSASYNAMLLRHFRNSNDNPELLTDINMYNLFQNNIRGGITSEFKRYVKANNKYLPEDEQDKTKPSNYILYVDANNLYGYGMKQYLPYSDFKWLDDVSKFYDTNNIISISDTNTTGYVFDINLIYPQELHDLHNNYPIAPENINITYDMLSDYNKQYLESESIKLSNNNIKLCPNLNNKKNYVCHYRHLKLLLQLGLKIEKINRVLSFTQKPWLESYIDFNTNKRKLAKNPFQKNLFKLANNSLFGKTMENINKRMNYKLINNQKSLLKLTKKPTFKSSNIINENLVGVEMLKGQQLLDKPIYCGFSILELSKVLMYDFYYNVMIPKYGNKCELIYTDTDSFVFNIYTDDIYKDMEDPEFNKYFDFSEYPKTHKLYNESNKAVIGKFKDETKSMIITEFIALRAKMYSYKILDDENEHKKAKGIKTYVVKKNIKHEDYLKCLTTKTNYNHKMNGIRSFNHQIYSMSQTKTSLSYMDDKRYILKDGINTLAYGHYKINM